MNRDTHELSWQAAWRLTATVAPCASVFLLAPEYPQRAALFRFRPWSRGFRVACASMPCASTQARRGQATAGEISRSANFGKTFDGRGSSPPRRRRVPRQDTGLYAANFDIAKTDPRRYPSRAATIPDASNEIPTKPFRRSPRKRSQTWRQGRSKWSGNKSFVSPRFRWDNADMS
jgi:hypothetical protein